jgi:hypothetical protein
MPPPPPPPAALAPAFTRAPPFATSVLAGLLPVSLPGSSQQTGTYPSAPRAVPLAALTPQQLAYARGAPGYDGRYGWAEDDPRALCDQPSGGGRGGRRGGQLPLGFSSSASSEEPAQPGHPPGQGHGPPQGFVARDRREDSSGADRPSGAQQHEPHYQQVQQPRQQPQQLPHSQHRAPQQPPQEPSSGVTWGAGGVGDWPAPQEVSLSDAAHAAEPSAHAAASPEGWPRRGAAAASAAHLPTGKRPSGVDALLALASACSNAADDGDGAAVDAELEA